MPKPIGRLATPIPTIAEIKEHGRFTRHHWVRVAEGHGRKHADVKAWLVMFLRSDVGQAEIAKAPRWLRDLPPEEIAEKLMLEMPKAGEDW